MNQEATAVLLPETGQYNKEAEVLRGAFPGDSRGAAPTACSLRLLNGLAFGFRLQGGPSAG